MITKLGSSPPSPNAAGGRPPVQNRLQAWCLFSPQTTPRRYTHCYPEPGLSPVPSHQFNSPPSFVPISQTWFLPEGRPSGWVGSPLFRESCCRHALGHLGLCVLSVEWGLRGGPSMRRVVRVEVSELHGWTTAAKGKRKSS